MTTRFPLQEETYPRLCKQKLAGSAWGIEEGEGQIMTQWKALTQPKLSSAANGVRRNFQCVAGAGPAVRLTLNKDPIFYSRCIFSFLWYTLSKVCILLIMISHSAHWSLGKFRRLYSWCHFIANIKWTQDKWHDPFRVFFVCAVFCFRLAVCLTLPVLAHLISRLLLEKMTRWSADRCS